LADWVKAAFCTADELYEMAFGLCNGPVTFQRLMDLLLADIQWSTYLDDIIVLGKLFEDHLDKYFYNRER